MGMFGRLINAPTTTDANVPLTFAPGFTEAPKPMPRRGMFGSAFGNFMSNLMSSRGLQIAGAGLRQAGGVNGALDSVVAALDAQSRQASEDAYRKSQQDWQQQVQGRQQQQWGREDQQNAAMDAFEASLPENQRMLFGINPEAFMRANAPSAWEHFYGRAGRIRPDGSVELGGRIPERPNQALFGNGTDGQIFTPNPAGVAAPQVGEVQEGYRYNGGDPADPNSWSAVR